MQASFTDALALVLRLEGGYVDDPADPGGATNLGVTRATLASFRGRPVGRDDVRALQPADVVPLYRRRYWDAVRADELPAGIDCAVFDAAVHSGPGRAVRLLQDTLGVACDGILGPRTLAAARAADPARLIPALAQRRLAFLAALPGWRRFGRGWSRRVSSVSEAALALAQAIPRTGPGPAPIPRAPLPSPSTPPAKETSMTDVKSILASRTVWSNLVGLAAIALSVAGFDTRSVDAQALADAGLQVVAAGSFIASTVFRIVATRRLVGRGGGASGEEAPFSPGSSSRS